MSTPAAALSASQIFEQFAQLMLQPILVDALPIVTNAFSQATTVSGDPVGLALLGNKLIADLAGTLPAIKTADIAALAQVANAVVTAIGAKLSASPVTAAGVGAEAGAAITGS